MSGKGFARRVTLEDLHLFSPLLGKEKSQASRDETDQGDLPNRGARTDPALAAAEQLFAGSPFRTGMHFSSAHRGQRAAGAEPESGAAGAAPNVDRHRGEELLMRVRPRRNGTQLQISLLVHSSEFMREASHVVSAASGTVRHIGFDFVKSGTKRNLARFEAPELAGKNEPVARFRWIDNGKTNSAQVLQYEIFDAANSAEGQQIFTALESGIGAVPTRNLKALGRTETVISKKNRATAQWYRLSPLK